MYQSRPIFKGHVCSRASATASTCMLVISNMMPPTASRERAGKSMLEMAKERGGGKQPLKLSQLTDIVGLVRIRRTKKMFFTWYNKRQHQSCHGVQRSVGGKKIISTQTSQKSRRDRKQSVEQKLNEQMPQHMSGRPCVCPPYLPTSHPVAICIPQEAEFISLLFSLRPL